MNQFFARVMEIAARRTPRFVRWTPPSRSHWSEDMLPFNRAPASRGAWRQPRG